jgi:hypothetical protein
MPTTTPEKRDQPLTSTDLITPSAGLPVTAAEPTPPAPKGGVLWRALLISVICLPPLIFLGEYTEIVSQGSDVFGMSLIMLVFVALLLIMLINRAVYAIKPAWALTQRELLFIYAAVSASITIAGLGMLQFLIAVVAGIQHFNTTTPGYEKWQHVVPRWVLPDIAVVPGFYEGKGSFFTTAVIAGWSRCIVIWTLFLADLLVCFFSVAMMFSKQWVENEHLSFPLLTIPLEVTVDGGRGPIWRNKGLWLGIGVSVVLESLASIHYSISPLVPYLPIKPTETIMNLVPPGASPPVAAAAPIWMAFYPLAIGLAFLVNTDISFSCWFGYFLVKLENVASVAMGYRSPGAATGVPYNQEQAVGAFVGIAILSFAYARNHFRSIFARRKPGADPETVHFQKTARFTVAVAVLSASLLVIFGCAIGLSLPVSIIFILLFLLFALAFARIQAEVGLPWAFGPILMSHGTIVDMAGTTTLSANDSAGLGLISWFDTDFRTLILPHHVEGLKLAQSGPFSVRGFAIGLAICSLVAAAAGWLSILGIYYHFGAASANLDPWRTGQGHYGWDQVNTWILHPGPPNMTAAGWSLGACLFTLLLGWLRVRFLWWPLHPIGYAIANTETLNWLWCPMLVGWLCKTLILRYTGSRGYRQFLPFFIGLVIGDYVISIAWAIFDLATGTSGYRTFPV